MEYIKKTKEGIKINFEKIFQIKPPFSRKDFKLQLADFNLQDINSIQQIVVNKFEDTQSLESERSTDNLLGSLIRNQIREGKGENLIKAMTEKQKGQFVGKTPLSPIKSNIALNKLEEAKERESKNEVSFDSKKLIMKNMLTFIRKARKATSEIQKKYNYYKNNNYTKNFNNINELSTQDLENLNLISGLPMDHIKNMTKEALNFNTIVGFRPISERVGQLIGEWGCCGKRKNVKGKSANIGKNLKGYIPINQKLSKAEKGKITKRELKEYGEIFNEKFVAQNLFDDEFNEVCYINIKNGTPFKENGKVLFLIKKLINDEVKYFYENNPEKEYEKYIKKIENVKVLYNETKKAYVTSDYDLLCVGHRTLDTTKNDELTTSEQGYLSDASKQILNPINKATGDLDLSTHGEAGLNPFPEKFIRKKGGFGGYFIIEPILEDNNLNAKNENKKFNLHLLKTEDDILNFYNRIRKQKTNISINENWAWDIDKNNNLVYSKTKEKFNIKEKHKCIEEHDKKLNKLKKREKEKEKPRFALETGEERLINGAKKLMVKLRKEFGAIEKLNKTRLKKCPTKKDNENYKSSIREFERISIELKNILETCDIKLPPIKKVDKEKKTKTKSIKKKSQKHQVKTTNFPSVQKPKPKPESKQEQVKVTNFPFMQEDKNSGTIKAKMTQGLKNRRKNQTRQSFQYYRQDEQALNDLQHDKIKLNYINDNE